MRTGKILSAATCVLLFTFSVSAVAVDIKWNGFMSVIAGQTMDDGTTYMVDPTVGGLNSGALYDDKLRFSPDSLVALQAHANISDNLSATVQILGKGGDDYSPDIEWAYLSYEFNENVTVNAGRFRFPAFYYSDSLDIGYSYYWIRPPVDIYSVFFSRVEGVNVLFNKIVGPVELEAQVWWGGINIADDTELTSTSQNDITNNQGLALRATWNWFTYRTVYHTTDFRATTTSIVENDPDPMNPFWTQFGTEVGDPADFDIAFVGHAFMADIGNFLWRSEYATTNTKFPAAGVDVDVDVWYGSIGYRLHDFTPHITYVEKDDPGFFAAAAKTKTMTYGVAWDFTPGAVFKLEYLNRTIDSAGAEEDTSVLAFGIDAMF